ALLANLRAGLGGELVALGAFPSGRRLVDVNSVRAGVKLVLILLLLLVEERGLGFPGGSQVAFFATFFASTGNLGRQNKTDLVGLAGLLAGFVFGVVAAFLTSRLPEFPLLLALVFLGEFVANLAYQRLPRYGARYLPGPEHADAAYDGIVDCLQEIDANLEYVHFLLGLEKEHPLRQRFFEVIADYPALASSKLQTVARQFQQPPATAARIEPVRWEPDASRRWEDAARDVRPVPDAEVE